MTATAGTQSNAAPVGRFLLVGHCVPDAYMLKGAVERFVPGASVASVTQQEELERELPGADVLLVNRMLDGYFQHPLGTALVRDLVGRPGARASVVLISNLVEAQREAVQAGAMPGFGKSDLYAETTRDALRAALDRAMQRP